MNVATGWRLAAALACLVAAGCNNGPFGSNPQAAAAPKAPPEQLALAEQNRQLLERTSILDRDNVETKNQLAQAQQLIKQREDELVAVREQLKDSSQQLAALSTQKQSVERQAESLLASTRRGGGAIIKPNNSLAASLPQFTSPDIAVRADGDVVRIAVLADRLFQPGTAQLSREAQPLLESISAELSQRYPDQTIGVEGHTDTEPGAGAAAWTRAHQLSTAQAGAALDFLVNRGRIRPQQVFVAGHGGNFPVYSNASPEGRTRNRRIEFVVYPERAER